MQLVDEAKRNNVGVAAFNVIHIETAEALVAASERAQLPLILQLSHNCVRYHGSFGPIGHAMLDIANFADTPVAVHLDHCESESLAREAIDAGFSSVMYDGSTKPYKENVEATRRIADYAHTKQVDVEAELGEIGGKRGAHTPGVRTDPEEGCSFASDTDVDILAVAVGSEHAMQERTAKLDLDLIGRLDSAIPVPLVLHGSSGVPDDEIRSAIKAGMTKINVSTHLNGFFTRGVRAYLDRYPDVTDSRKYIAAGRDAMSEEAERLLKVIAL